MLFSGQEKTREEPACPPTCRASPYAISATLKPSGVALRAMPDTSETGAFGRQVAHREKSEGFRSYF